MDKTDETTASLVDTHAHIQSENFADDVDQVMERAHRAGVEKIIVVGGAGELSTNESGLEIARHHARTFATVGPPARGSGSRAYSDASTRKHYPLTHSPSWTRRMTVGMLAER